MLWAYLNTNARYRVWTDNNAFWNNTDHPIEQASMNLYDTTTSAQLQGHWLSAPSIEIKTTEHYQAYQIWMGIIEHIPSWVQNDYWNQCPSNFYCSLVVTNEIHVWLSYQGTRLPMDHYSGIAGYESPNNSGGIGDVGGVGSDVLAIIAAAVSLVPGGGPGAATAAIASVLVKYILPSGPSFSAKQEPGGQPPGVFLKDFNDVSNDLGDTLNFQFALLNPGVWTFTATVTPTIHWVQVCTIASCTVDHVLASPTYYLSTYYND
jgi:hypothetical protein